MIVLLLSDPQLVEALSFDLPRATRSIVHVTGSRREARKLLREWIEESRIRRLVLVASEYFGASNSASDRIGWGAGLATMIKREMSGVWVFIYGDNPVTNTYVDGIIPKKNGAVSPIDTFRSFIQARPETIATKEELRARLAWLR